MHERRLKQLVGRTPRKRIDAFDELRDALVVAGGATAWWPAAGLGGVGRDSSRPARSSGR